MKHLLRYKLFESVEKLYEPISEIDYNDSFKEANLEKATAFTRDELFDLRDYFENIDFCWELETLKPDLVRTMVKQMPYSKRLSGQQKMINYPFIKIIKFDDDWFYARIAEDYFKCDTFEGVIQLCKDWTKGQIK